MTPRVQLKARVWRNDGSEGNDGWGPSRTPFRAPPPAARPKPKAKARPAAKKATRKAPKSKTVYQRLMGDDAF